MLLEEIEAQYGLPFIAITQPVQNTPTGRMVRRTLATVAAFQTEQQSLDVRGGIARRGMNFRNAFGRNLRRKTPNPRNPLFELLARWRKSCRHNEKALQLVDRRASKER